MRFSGERQGTRGEGQETRDPLSGTRSLTSRFLTGPDERPQSFNSKTLRTLMLFAAVMFAVGALAATPLSKPTMEQVGNQVYCQCGCVTVLNHCPHLPSECQSRAQMQTVILKDVQQGKANPAILQDLVDRFGVHVLASPPATGFNLTVWVLPGVALIIGLAIVLLIVRRWRAKVSAPAEEEPAGPVDPKIMAAVEEEMNRVGTTKD